MSKGRQYRLTVFPSGGGQPEILPLQSKPELEQLQRLVGGYIEEAPRQLWYTKRKFSPRSTAYCDEEGKLKGKPVNRHFLTADFRNQWDVLVGDVVVVEPIPQKKNDQS